jgi:outer membrane protein assembly factor BamD (BamD/ComL family)
MIDRVTLQRVFFLISYIFLCFFSPIYKVPVTGLPQGKGQIEVQKSVDKIPLKGKGRRKALENLLRSIVNRSADEKRRVAIPLIKQSISERVFSQDLFNLLRNTEQESLIPSYLEGLAIPKINSKPREALVYYQQILTLDIKDKRPVEERIRYLLEKAYPWDKYLFKSNPAVDRDILSAYMASLQNQKAQPRVAFMLAYLNHAYMDANSGIGFIEEAIQKFPKSPYTTLALNYLIKISWQHRNYPVVEKWTLYAKAQNIKVPKATEYLQKSLLAQANQLLAQGQLDEAAAKYQRYYKEFPAAPGAPAALYKAINALFKAQKIGEGIDLLEIYIATYPKKKEVSGLFWRAAEGAKTINRKLDSAIYYERFARTYPQDKRREAALVESAQLYLDVERYSRSIALYELLIKISPRNKLKYAKAIADITGKYGLDNQAISSFNRIMKLSKDPDDKVWSLCRIFEIRLRAGDMKPLSQAIKQILNSKIESPANVSCIANARYQRAILSAITLPDLDLNSNPNLKKGLINIKAVYDKNKEDFTAPCQVSGMNTCSVGYYKAAQMAELIASKILEVDPPPTLNPNEAEAIQKLKGQYSKELIEDSKTLAFQGESAISSGVTSPEMGDQIKDYAKKHRGTEVIQKGGGGG